MTNDESLILWNLLPHPSPNHIVRLFGRDSGGRVIGDFARSPTEIKRFADTCSGHYNCYVCPNPTTRVDSTRHSGADVSHWSFLLIDIDPIDENPEPKEALDKVMTRLSGLFGRDLYKVTPTIISSGRGIQIWMRGEDIEFNDEFPRDKARKIMSWYLTKMISERLGLIYGCKVDTCTSDLPRPMRMPGTLNLKTGLMSEFLAVQQKPFPWLFPILIGGTPKDVLTNRDSEDQVAPGTRWQMVFNRLTLSAQTYLMHGKEEPGRHKVMFHTARSLAELGISREEAKRAIVRANRLKGEEQELSLGEIEHGLDTGYANVT